MTLSTKIEVFTDLQLFAVGLHTCTAVARSLCVSWAFLFMPGSVVVWLRAGVQTLQWDRHIRLEGSTPAWADHHLGSVQPRTFARWWRSTSGQRWAIN